MASRARSEHRSLAVRRVRSWLRGHRRQASAGFSVLTAAGGIVLAVLPGAALTGIMVTLNFDNNSLSQYALGYQQALQPHGVNATFYVSSGSVSSGSSTKVMSWSQLSALSAAGNDIGGKTVDGISLTTLSTQQQISEICIDRQNLVQHGLKPDTLAYPGGSFNTTIEAEVQNCGYGNARTAGSLSPTGPLYAETLPPKNWLALRAYAPTGQISLSNLESLVSGAAAHGGGWVPIVIGKVCSQTLDPNNYSTCTTSSGWIDLGDLNTFLTWVQNAGQSGGAPAGAVFNTMGSTAISADMVAPATTISCNGAPCASTAYTSTVSVSLAATDLGSGVASTYYTTDGSTPTTSSTVYAGPFTVKQNTTVNFFSTDLAGNAEQPNSQAIAFTTVVSLTFDDGIENQYTLAFQHALQPHNATGTFFINTSGTNAGLSSGSMTWDQLTALNNAGNEIGGHTLGESNLTTDDTQTATNEVCQDRQNLVNHGFYPTSFAYPFGAYNATAESIVQGCGYTSGRAAGGVDVTGPGAGPVYAETIPPPVSLATRTVYNASTGSPAVAPMLTLSNMEAAITGASQNGGGWGQLVFHHVCSQNYDSANYTNCTSSSATV